MASTTAMYTGLSGLTANAANLNVIGNNIANVNTTAYKSNRMLFSTAFSRTFSLGSAPSDDSGGTNPGQVGLGVGIAGTQRDFRNGALAPTGQPGDLAIEGEGFFIVDRTQGTAYTRAGAFTLNANNQMVSIDGDQVMGFGVDDQFRVVEGALVPITIPLGSLTVAEATQNVQFSGNLDAGGDLPTQGSSISIMGTDTTGLSLIAGATVPASPGDLLETGSLLTEIEDPALPGSGTTLFTAGQIIQVAQADQGGKTVPTADFTIAAASTVQDLMDFLTQALGIQTGAGTNPDGDTPGLSLDPVTGVLTITGNTGTINDLTVESSDIRLLSAAGDVIGSPFVTDKLAAADGESVRTTFVAYDSLGNTVAVDLGMVIDNKDATGTTWRYYVESADDTDQDLAIATGTLSFDTSGVLTTTDPVQIDIDRAGTGAATPMQIALEFGAEGKAVTALADEQSVLAATFQDGSPIGTLSSYAVGPDGMITGSFTNGITRTVGQVAVATFTNPGGLVDAGSNVFTVGPNSGSPVVTTPGDFGTGKIVGGALELSNVDLSQQFIQMILASTGYTACSRVVRTADELMQQLLVLGR